MDVNIIAQWTALIVAAATAITAWGRYTAKAKISHDNDKTQQQVTNDLLNNLRDEIKRLEEIIKQQSERISSLEMCISKQKDIELHGAGDFGILEQISKTMPCVTCTSQGAAFNDLKVVVERIKERREARHALVGLDI